MSANLHCHETGRQIELLNEHSQSLRINYMLAKDDDESDRYPVVDLVIEGVDGGVEAFRMCSREDCDKVIELLFSVKNAAYPRL